MENFVLGILTVLIATFVCYYCRLLVRYKNLPSRHIEFMILNFCIRTKKKYFGFFFQPLMKILQCHISDGICVIWFFKPFVILFNEEAVKLLLNDPQAVDKPSEYKHVEFCMKDAVFSCNGEKWKKLRGFTSQAFQILFLRNNIDVYNTYSEKLVQQLKIAKPEETTKYLKKNVLQAFMESVYGLKADSDENKVIVETILESINKLSMFIVQKITSPWLYWDFMLHIFPSARECLKTYDEAICISRELLDNAKEEIIKRRQCESGVPYTPKSIAEILIDQHIRDPSFTSDDVLSQVNAIVAGNAGAVSASILWCLFLLGHHPEIQEKAFEEMISVTGDDIAYEDLRNFKYLECIIMESFRLYPTIPIFGRQTKKEYTCGKYTIPKNTPVFIINYILHRNPDAFPDPEKFDPARFMTSNSKINDGNYVPFAEGMRSCLGKKLIILTMKVFVCHLIRNFRIISLDRREELELSWNIILTPSKNLRMKFVPRNNKETLNKK